MRVQDAAVGYLLLSLCLPGQSQIRRGFGADLSKLVILGDSLSAGVQNFALLDSQQPNGYGSVIARQANVPLVLPLVPPPGAPNALQLTSLNPPVITPAPGTLPRIPRDHPCEQPTNIAVPGITLQQALTDRPSPTPPTPVDGWLDIVLGFPNPLGSGLCGTTGPALTEIEMAAALKPTTVIEWLGNNDALIPALTGALDSVTPLLDFAISYDEILDHLQRTGATILTANIPDLTEIPYFIPVRDFAKLVGLPAGMVSAKLGVTSRDYLRLTAQPIALQIISGTISGPLPATCPLPISALPGSGVACVLTAEDASRMRNVVDAYNFIILAESELHGAYMADMHRLVDDIYQHGVQIGAKHLNAAFLGGLFSLDGIHPTNTGYGILANKFISMLNSELGTNIPPADLAAIAATDPLVPPIHLEQTSGPFNSLAK